MIGRQKQPPDSKEWIVRGVRLVEVWLDVGGQARRAQGEADRVCVAICEHVVHRYETDAVVTSPVVRQAGVDATTATGFGLIDQGSNIGTIAAVRQALSCDFLRTTTV